MPSIYIGRSDWVFICQHTQTLSAFISACGIQYNMALAVESVN